MKLILASTSSRRAEVLRQAGFAFEVVSAAVDEAPRRGEAPVNLVKRLAAEKARTAGKTIREDSIVIAADTEVALEGRIFGKPASAEEAKAMLATLAGKTHQVVTGLAVLRMPRAEMGVEHEETLVTFAPLSEAEIAAYVATREPFDKAGGYAVQGRGGVFVTRIEGCYFNVVGLPLARLYRMIREMGWEGTQ